jgi:hypothetical protein
MRFLSAVLEHIVHSVTWLLGELNNGLHDTALFCACDKCCRFSILSEIQTVCSARRAGCAAEKLCRHRAGPATTPTNPTTTLLLPLETAHFSVVKTVVAVCRVRPCDLVCNMALRLHKSPWQRVRQGCFLLQRGVLAGRCAATRRGSRQTRWAAARQPADPVGRDAAAGRPGGPRRGGRQTRWAAARQPVGPAPLLLLQQLFSSLFSLSLSLSL